MSIKKLCIMAMFIALNVAISLITVPMFGGAIRLSFTFLVSMCFAANFGYLDCVIYGIAVDIISFFAFNYGDVFFLGYTLSAVLGLIIYRFYLQHGVDVYTVLFSKATVNLFVNVFIGSIWRAMLYSKGYWYYFINSLWKNIVMLPVEVALFYIVYKTLKPLFDKYISS